jgi:hypothetical protein
MFTAVSAANSIAELDRRGWKKGPCFDFSKVLSKHSCPFVRITAELPIEVNTYDIIEMVTGFTSRNTIAKKWTTITNAKPEFATTTTYAFEGETVGEL